MREESCLLVLSKSTLLLRFCIQKLRQDSRYAALRVFSDKLGERLLRVVAFEQFRARCSDLQSSHHIPSDDGKEGNRACTNVRPKLLLQDLKKVPLREIHPEDGVKFVIPEIGFRSDWHGQGYKLL